MLSPHNGFGWLCDMYLGHYVQISRYLVTFEPLFALITCFSRIITYRIQKKTLIYIACRD
jgi:hypothetical protein